MIETIEHIGGDFGVTVIYSQDPQYADVSVKFFTCEITGRGQNDTGDGYDVALYARKGAEASGDEVTDPREAERYFEGSVKWDGCSHVNFGDENGYLHLCGGAHFQKLAATLESVYERCGELMEASGGHLLSGEFKCATPDPQQDA